MRTSRRRFLATVATVGTASIAGCGSKVKPEPGEETDKAVPAPSVTTPDGWSLTTPDSQPVVFAKGTDFAIDWTAVGRTNLYENMKLRNRVKEETFGRIDRPLMVAFASRIDFFPDLTHIGTRFKQDKINSQIKSKMRTNMEEFGLQDPTYKGEIQRPRNSNFTSYHKWTATYPIEEIPIDDVDIPHVDQTSFTIGGDSLKVAGIAGVWKEGTHLLAAGGVYPAAPYAEEKNWDISGGIHLSLQIDMGFRPTAYNQQIKSIMNSVDP